MRALILWSDPGSMNLGVRALASGTQRLLEQCFPGVSVCSQGFGAGDAPVRIGDPRTQFKRLLSPRGSDLVDWVRSFDLVVDTRAGDSFADIYGLKRLTTMNLMAEIVRRAGVPLVLGPQTIGPFDSRRGRLLGRRALRTSRIALARDEVSSSVAARLGRPVDALATDVVFVLDPVPAPVVRRDVVLNPSGLLWRKNSHVDSLAYQRIVLELGRELIARGRRLSLIAHVLDSPLVDNDVPVLQEVADRLDGDVEVLIPADLDDARQLLASAEVVVGSRMHACLNALSVGRPAIPLAYSRKFAPLLDGIGWRRTVDLRQPTANVDEVIKAVEDPSLQTAVASLSAAAAEKIERARDVLVRAF